MYRILSQIVKIRYILPLALSLLSPLTTTAQETKTKEITGAFGIKLGQVIDTESEKYKPLKGGEGEFMYTFEPEQRAGNFQVYAVIVTPTSKKVYVVGCSSDFKAETEASAKYAAVLKALEGIYGKFEVVDTKLNYGAKSQHKLIVGKRMIIIEQKNGVKNEVSMAYMDLDGVKLSDKERVDIESSKIDPSEF